MIEHRRQAFRVGGRGRHADHVQTGLTGERTQLTVVLGGQVDYQQAVDAGFAGIAHEGIRAITIDRIVVAHQHDRRGLILGAELAHHLQGFQLGLAGLEGPHGGGLNGRTIGHRIAEGHAQFDDVGTGGG